MKNIHDGRYRKAFQRAASMFVSVGNALIFFMYIIGPLTIIFGLRIEVMTGESYSYPKKMIVVALAAVSLLFVFLLSHYKSLKKGGGWRWMLLFCLFVLMMIGLSDSVLGHLEYGLAYIVVRGYISSAVFLAWILFNYFYWFYIRPTKTCN